MALPCSLSLPTDFAHLLRSAQYVEEIVGDLVNETEIARIVTQPVAMLCIGLAEDGAGLTAEIEQRAGLHALQRNDAAIIERSLRRLHVDHLAADHAVAACGFGELACQLAAYLGRRMGGGIGENFERECQKRVAGEHGGRLVERHMDGWPPAPEIVVVHAGEIVMHERISVHGFDRRSHPKRARGIDIEESCTAQDEERAQPLAAGEDGITASPHARGREDRAA